MNTADMERRRRELQDAVNRRQHTGPCKDCGKPGMRDVFMYVYPDNETDPGPCPACFARVQAAGIIPTVIPMPAPPELIASSPWC